MCDSIVSTGETIVSTDDRTSILLTAGSQSETFIFKCLSIDTLTVHSTVVDRDYAILGNRESFKGMLWLLLDQGSFAAEQVVTVQPVKLPHSKSPTMFVVGGRLYVEAYLRLKSWVDQESERGRKIKIPEGLSVVGCNIYSTVEVTSQEEADQVVAERLKSLVSRRERLPFWGTVDMLAWARGVKVERDSRANRPPTKSFRGLNLTMLKQSCPYPCATLNEQRIQKVLRFDKLAPTTLEVISLLEDTLVCRHFCSVACFQIVLSHTVHSQPLTVNL